MSSNPTSKRRGALEDAFTRPIITRDLKSSDAKGHTAKNALHVQIPPEVPPMLAAVREVDPRWRALANQKENNNNNLTRHIVYSYLAHADDFLPELQNSTCFQQGLKLIEIAEREAHVATFQRIHGYIARLRKLGRIEEADREQATLDSQLASFDSDTRGFIEAALAQDADEIQDRGGSRSRDTVRLKFMTDDIMSAVGDDD